MDRRNNGMAPYVPGRMVRLRSLKPFTGVGGREEVAACCEAAASISVFLFGLSYLFCTCFCFLQPAFFRCQATSSALYHEHPADILSKKNQLVLLLLSPILERS